MGWEGQQHLPISPTSRVAQVRPSSPTATNGSSTAPVSPSSRRTIAPYWAETGEAILALGEAAPRVGAAAVVAAGPVGREIPTIPPRPDYLAFARVAAAK